MLKSSSELMKFIWRWCIVSCRASANINWRRSELIMIQMDFNNNMRWISCCNSITIYNNNPNLFINGYRIMNEQYLLELINHFLMIIRPINIESWIIADCNNNDEMRGATIFDLQCIIEWRMRSFKINASFLVEH